jgi:hypothetical protein
VVASVKFVDLADRNAIGQIYFDYRQNIPQNLHLMVKTAGEDEQVTAAIRRQ